MKSLLHGSSRCRVNKRSVCSNVQRRLSTPRWPPCTGELPSCERLQDHISYNEQQHSQSLFPAFILNCHPPPRFPPFLASLWGHAHISHRSEFPLTFGAPSTSCPGSGDQFSFFKAVVGLLIQSALSAKQKNKNKRSFKKTIADRKQHLDLHMWGITKNINTQSNRSPFKDVFESVVCLLYVLFSCPLLGSLLTIKK